ncbi:MAG: ABC transporter ATP-binding protein [Rhodanobacteraceae bacterium]|jgi:ABC-2 type transport system ATP-binding protein|nr:ABC transporter ATP-binding protein [Rhodanobacteraceae bacterium]
MIQAESLRKVFGDGTVAVDGISFKVDQGEIYCIYGANGAGKTTTINMFLNFVEPTGGSALIDGIDVAHDPLAAKERLAFLSENVRLYDTLTAVENLLFFTGLNPSRKVRAAECREALAICGLDTRFHDARLATFSKGMRQKCGLAICLLKRAAAIFLDEPLSGLDPIAAAHVLATIRRISDAGAAVLMSTHDLLRTKEIADKVSIMKDGRILLNLDRAALTEVDLFSVYTESLANGH